MKLLIVSNNAPWQSWPGKVQELKNWFSPNLDLEINLIHVQFQNVPFSQYTPDGGMGVDKNWLFHNVSHLGKGYDLLLFVLPKSQWQRADKYRGWRTFDPYGAVDLQLGADEFEPFWKQLLGINGEMFHQVARHEIMHGLAYIKCGPSVPFHLPPQEGQCLDTTHYWWDRDNLRQALEELHPAPVIPNKVVDILHHSATSRDNTNLEALIADQVKRYGRSFYQTIITADGTVHHQHDILNTRLNGVSSRDTLVVGDFTQEKPTEAQLEALYVLFRNRPVFGIGHKDAKKYGATSSECPGTLIEDYKAHRAQVESLAKQISFLMAEIKRIFGLK